MFRILSLLTCLSFTHICLAQYNDSTSYLFNYTSTGSINKADDNSAYLLNNGLKFSVRKKSVSLNLNNSWLYGKQNKEITNNDFSTALDFNLYKTFPHFFYWGLVNYNTSYSLKINNQLLIGAGVAYNLLDTTVAYLNISDGVLFDASDITLADSTREVYQTYRNSFRLLYKFIVKRFIEFNGSNFIQHSFQRSSDYNIKLNNSISLKLNKWLSLTGALTYNRINRTKSENLFMSYGLTFERYF